MKNDKPSSIDFGPWAAVGVIAPLVVILALRFLIAPHFWPDSARMLGDALGKVFMLYLIAVAIVATLVKIKSEKH